MPAYCVAMMLRSFMSAKGNRAGRISIRHPAFARIPGRGDAR
jgi:hypothetical protein